MLDESPQHRTERRGCGLTQATRLLAERINRPRDPRDPADLAMFHDWPQRDAQAVASASLAAGWPGGWRDLAAAPPDVHDAIRGLRGAAALLALPARLAQVESALRLPESRLLLALVADVLGWRTPQAAVLPPMADKPETGSCSQAEEFFLEIAHGKVRRGGRVNVFVDSVGQPLLVEKIALGESHSALAVHEVALNGVTLPPGALLALRHQPDAQPLHRHARGEVLPLAALAAARLLRLTTLALPPGERERAFGDQFRRQVQGNLLSPRSTTLDDLRHHAGSCLQPA